MEMSHLCQFNKFDSQSDNPKTDLKIMQFSFYPT